MLFLSSFPKCSMGGDGFPHQGGCGFKVLGAVWLDLIIKAPGAPTTYKGELPMCQEAAACSGVQMQKARCGGRRL